MCIRDSPQPASALARMIDLCQSAHVEKCTCRAPLHSVGCQWRFVRRPAVVSSFDLAITVAAPC
eukprot:1039866-Alexandrium_andersonii.AAC.1